MRNKTSQQKGFALLVGVLVTTILISITFTMFTITLKQLSLSMSGRDSLKALYAADTGIECAMFNDTHIEEAFARVETYVDGVTGDITLEINQPGADRLTCNGQSILYQLNSSVQNVVVTTFRVPSTDSGCADVTVTKDKFPTIENGKNIDIVRTKIQSRGYNTCASNSDPFRLERGLETNY